MSLHDYEVLVILIQPLLYDYLLQIYILVLRLKFNSIQNNIKSF